MNAKVTFKELGVVVKTVVGASRLERADTRRVRSLGG